MDPLRCVKNFDLAANGTTITFEIVLITVCVAVLFGLSRIRDRIGERFLIVAMGVFVFELFTAPLWDNLRLGEWAYLYQDVSWILTLGWSTMILAVVVVVDRFLPDVSALGRFAVYLVALTVLVFLNETLVVDLGIREYAPEVTEALLGPTVLGMPIEVFYYAPVFTSLVVAFYKYWELHLERVPLVPVLKQKWLRNLAITVVGVVVFELVIDPAVVNANFPAWSYVYRDITFLMTGLWVLIILVATNVIDRVFVRSGLLPRFFGYLVVITVIALPLEAWFIANGFRVYGPSAVANFSGVLAPFGNVPIEVAGAIPLYLALIICFVRYWEIVGDNNLMAQKGSPA